MCVQAETFSALERSVSWALTEVEDADDRITDSAAAAQKSYTHNVRHFSDVVISDKLAERRGDVGVVVSFYPSNTDIFENHLPWRMRILNARFLIISLSQ